MKKVLVVEDEKDVQDLLVLHLKREGLDVTAVSDGENAVRAFAEGTFQLAIFDWMLPGLTGLELCKKYRGRCPILMVTARADSADIIVGLEAGADDYITKPFDIPVFLARVRALLRRGERTGPENSLESANELRHRQLVMNIERHEVACGQDKIELTPSEFKLLTALLRNQGRVLSREKLIDCVQGEGVKVIDRAIDTHVFGLRKKLGVCGDFVETIRGVGYRIQLE
ncbi:MAG: response regulator transcription factor [Bacteriovoracia bacterium]